jgi:hypothetical protein
MAKAHFALQKQRLSVMRSVPPRYRSCEKKVRLESALVRLARNQVTWGKMGRLRILSGVVSGRTSALSKREDFLHSYRKVVLTS